MPNQAGHTQPVAGEDGLDDERTGREISQEADFGLGTESRCKEIRDLGDRQERDYERPRVRFQQLA